MHIEHTQFGSATSVNSLGLEAVAIPDWTRTRTTSVADSLDDESALPGAFDAGAAEDSAWASALGLQFDEDLEMGDAFAPFAGLPSPVQAPTSAPPPSPVALVLERLSLLPRKRSASNTAGPLPTPPLSQGGDEEERPSWSSPATPRKSLRKNSIPLPSLFDDLPTTPVSLPPTLTRFTSALQSAIERRESSRVSLSPPPLLAPTPLPTTSTFDLYGHTLHFTGLSRPQGRLLPSDDTAAYVREQRCVAECVGEESSTRGRQGRMGEYFVKCMVRQEAFEREGEVDALSVLCLELQRESR